MVPALSPSALVPAAAPAPSPIYMGALLTTLALTGEDLMPFSPEDGGVVAASIIGTVGKGLQVCLLLPHLLLLFYRI